MADRKYARFLFASMYKLAAYIICCAALKGLCIKYASHPFETIIPAVAMIGITWFFLSVVEGGKRSFLASGYIVENIVPAGVWGIIAGSAGFILSLIFKHSRFTGLPSEFHFKEPLYYVLGSSFFMGLVIFGYFFHILQCDFGIYIAIAVSSLIYAVFEAVGREEFVLHLILAAFPAAAAGVMILHLGDVRSAVSFLFMTRLTALLIGQFISASDSFEFVFAVPAVSVCAMTSMIYAIAKEKAEAKKRMDEVMEMKEKKRRKNADNKWPSQ